MDLIVGLGNPGAEYAGTPHNLGFMVVDRLASDAGVRVTRPEENALVGVGKIEGRDVVLAKPLSYMNLSGGPVRGLLRRYELQAEQLLLVYDELALPWGQLRLRLRGSAGSHKGVQSVIAALDTMEFPRLRLGIDPGHPIGDGARFVLRKFRPSEEAEAEEIAGRAAEAVRLYISEGAEKAMTVINRRAQGQKEEEA
jgi:PTH1 family peptidyl-tRNA hydrolase